LNADLFAGIFVGGRGRRMGGVAKGLLVTPDGAPLVERTLAVVRELAIPRGRAATYFPETNAFVPLGRGADEGNTPASKSVIVSLRRASVMPT
jgi:hypothetical protein